MRPETRTRKVFIDPLIRAAQWDLLDRSQVRTELPLEGYDDKPWNDVTDYVLYRENGEILAVIEAKRTSFDSRFAEQQLRHYVLEIEKQQSFRPFGFTSNGLQHYFYDVELENKRRIAGFFSRDDLERLLTIRETRIPTSNIQIKTHISGRLYQIEAVKRICEAFETENKRRALLVMATGTGKTRTAMSIIDVSMRSNQARNILFVADRDALVDQAITEGFEKHLPDEPCGRIQTFNLEEIKTRRLFAVTLQTLSLCFQEFTPGFFDLIIFDEAHRSIFNKYSEVLEYFDARIIGLTATPAHFIDRDTFVKFHCFDDPPSPTFLYTYQQAIDDRVLVDYDLYRAATGFQRDGIRGAFLSEEERNLLLEQGYNPDDIDFDGTELERTVSNKDTLRKQWSEIMDVCWKDRFGQLPGKTIVFAMTQDHAQRLVDVFEEMYPQHPGLARVVTSKSDFHRTLVKDFKRENMPRIAVSVDMLETGVNVPEVINLVFMRPVQSQIKMQQMLGRGTRNNEACVYADRLPKGGKVRFLVIDFFGNEFNKQPIDDTPAQDVPVMVSLFNTRLKLLERDLKDQQSPTFQNVANALRQQISRIPRNAYSVQDVLPQIEDALSDDFWHYLTTTKVTFLRVHIAPLMRHVPGVDVEAETFQHKIERLKLQILDGKSTSDIADSIREDVSRLPKMIFDSNQQRANVIHSVLSADLEHLSPAQLDEIALLLADQMKYRSDNPNAILKLDLRDYIAARGRIVITQTGEEIYVEEYRKRVEERILTLVSQHPTIISIQRGERVSDEQLIDLERTMRRELSDGILELNDTNLHRSYGLHVNSLLSLLRHLLDFDTAALPDYRDIVARQFDQFIEQHEARYNADQLRFLRAVKNVLADKHKLDLNDLYEAPFTSYGADAVDRWFTEQEIQEILEFAAQLAA